MKRRIYSVLLVGALVGPLVASSSFAETVAERFEQAMKKKAEYCRTHKIQSNNRRCEITKLKPADPLATEEGRFAHSIKIPNPVPEDSGYKSGMTPEQYFDHLCKTEAGEFIYKTVENVEGLYMMRPRKVATDYELEHLYALEDPYGYENWEATNPGPAFVHPSRFKFLEMPIADRAEPPWRKDHLHPSVMPSPAGVTIQRYFGYDGRNQKSLEKEYDVKSKSQFGYTWRGITRPHDRELGIAGSELIILDLQRNEVLAVRRAYIKSGDVRNKVTGIWWMGGHVCSQNSTRLFRTSEFITSVVKPVQGKEAPNAGK
ncbi:MAG: hypothetical protein OEY28_06480 [Nitrospira sp.]|nr:hypothetical protein [Nitrospira sp.]